MRNCSMLLSSVFFILMVAVGDQCALAREGQDGSSTAEARGGAEVSFDATCDPYEFPEGVQIYRVSVKRENGNILLGCLDGGASTIDTLRVRPGDVIVWKHVADEGAVNLKFYYDDELRSPFWGPKHDKQPLLLLSGEERWTWARNEGYYKVQGGGTPDPVIKVKK